MDWVLLGVFTVCLLALKSFPGLAKPANPTHKLIGVDWILYFCRYQKAIEIYEKIAKESLDINLLKYGVRGHLLNAGLCQLCSGDIVAITKSLECYEVNILLTLFWVLLYTELLYSVDFSKLLFVQDLDPTFSRTREYKFLAVSVVFRTFAVVLVLNFLLWFLKAWCVILITIRQQTFIILGWTRSVLDMSGFGLRNWWGRCCKIHRCCEGV